jgi:hypothetical protein
LEQEIWEIDVIVASGTRAGRRKNDDTKFNEIEIPFVEEDVIMLRVEEMLIDGQTGGEQVTKQTHRGGSGRGTRRVWEAMVWVDGRDVLKLLEEDEVDVRGRPEELASLRRGEHYLAEGVIQSNVDCLTDWGLNVPIVLIEDQELVQDALRKGSESVRRGELGI